MRSVLIALPQMTLAGEEGLHCSLSAVTHVAFHPSMLRPASQVGPMPEAARMGEVG